MSLRVKLVLALVLLSTGAVLAIGSISYAATANRLDAEIQRSLTDAARNLDDRNHPAQPGPSLDRDSDHPPQTQSGQVVSQRLTATGAVLASPNGVVLPVDELDQKVAASAAGTSVEHTVSLDGEPYQVLTVSTSPGAVQLARSLAENDRVLASLRNLILVSAAAVLAVAAVAGWLIARQITRRLVRLTGAAEVVAATGRLDVNVPVAGSDEAGRLATAFNEMLAALHRSRDAQQRLVQDAGHELRTPLTSLRTNVTVLQRHDDLPADTRAQVLGDLDLESRELTTLVNELVELATDRRADEPTQVLALGPLVERVAERARRRTGRTVTIEADDSRVQGRPQELERAVSNLIDNAAKFDPDPDHVVEARVREGRVSVADRGPGIDDADRAHVFDRFYRAVDARSRPGSGLGLSIVADVADRHGGSAFTEPRPGGGACVGFELPLVAAPADEQVDLDGDGAP